LLPVPSVDQSLPSGRSLRTAAITAVAAVGVLLLGALIVHELAPHHAVARATSSPAIDRATASAPPLRALSAPGAPHAARRAAPAAPSETPPAGAALPVTARAAVAILADPTAFKPRYRFFDAARNMDSFTYETLPPFRSGTVKISRTDPTVWELNGMQGGGPNDLGPSGAVREAAVLKDDHGTVTSTWYAVDSGPLAPAFAVERGETLHVVSRALVEANRAEYPPEVTSLLDK
jgi:hypothetical protein